MATTSAQSAETALPQPCAQWPPDSAEIIRDIRERTGDKWNCGHLRLQPADRSRLLTCAFSSQRRRQSFRIRDQPGSPIRFGVLGIQHGLDPLRFGLIDGVVIAGIEGLRSKAVAGRLGVNPSLTAPVHVGQARQRTLRGWASDQRGRGSMRSHHLRWSYIAFTPTRDG
jgi:hypothetical protein